MTRFSKERLGIHFAKRHVTDVTIDVSEAYRQNILGAIKLLRDRPKTETVYRDEITYFRLAASSPRAFSVSTGIKIPNGNEKLEAFLAIVGNHPQEPIIVFCEFEDTAQELAGSISDRPSFSITGRVPVFLREEILQQFRKSSDGVLIMTSIGAEGIDLQFCSTMINFDLTWNPMVLEQRIGRIDRIGQLKSKITIYNFVISGSIDERIIRILGEKLGLVQGSVLEPSTLLGPDTARLTFFSEETLEQELAVARSLAHAMELTSGIITRDYSVIPAIDGGFCNPEQIQRASKNPDEFTWLNSSEAATAWYTDLIHRSKQLMQMISTYTPQ
jgi:hypothetical protein